ncbi:DUF1203 domain-containing protein [Luteibacter aegosomatis]|uniref:DUF1203 domain-containing protein n=1 Tax=Luteibacter aegosomatis TaxID=2911537 RepID=UPI001FFA046A|nr:DUF1203 domain-containing protein [Luteibacter aegosomatis]UPG85313.1 DUF1203 domain-containing protein [Luteibacter aegosomatis]
MSFRILGLDPTPFQPLFGLDADGLRRVGARRITVDASPGYPDRIEVRDASPGDTVILLNHVHQPADTAYRASHAIFIREHATERCDMVDAVPEAIRRRTMSLRAFDAKGEMVDADLVDGEAIEGLIARFFENVEVAYLHAHYAKRGCYAALIERA